ncbi:MAG: hypothetical protein KAR19_09520 [Bacteroidales bacterium]|nr:hypothetical protein [Bacteroidales bacterium]
MTSSQRIIRRMGYVQDQDGIMNRYLREGSNWDQHLERTKKFINDAFRDTTIRTVAVLGSGWLLDVPLADMAGRYEHLYLVDINHPPQIRKKVSELENVELVHADLSGGAVEKLWQYRKISHLQSIDNYLDELTLIPPLDHLNPDAVVSVNLLNQLDIILCDFLRKHGYFQQESANRFRSKIQAFHLEWITNNPGCLITDTLEVSVDKNENESSKSLLFTGLPESFRSDRWKWDFDTRGTYTPGTHTHMEVQAIEWS